ncbi:uncharacterized protein LOC122665006 isoform X3 [Telopea speciosissima]|uniref:uncharacterized protein LOC122665006 isoform X3 n=1 Tax=Telopea speciosissima TaxID=54955 RepID=UPI001CC50254|nr:uncharacterized protein LOC122665006 isoform X3 [Telopea speciosissima]
MDGFIVDEGGEAARKRRNGESCACSHVRAQHRRSKSASDRNFDHARRGVSHSTGKDPNESDDLQPKIRSHRAATPLHQDCYDKMTNLSLNHRASLENDIEQLQLHLQQEKSMRTMLEKAMGRASSTLSPGHRHFSAQTKELIAEIDLLEEEVANREQHVLSLYRNIFDHCISGAPSGKSSSLSSPAHTKNEVRKHPSIISSAFCSSSKKFPLQHFQVLSSAKESSKRKGLLQSKTRNTLLLCGKTNFHIEHKNSDPMKVHDKVPTLEKTPLSRTLKDHLYQCPSKLSEEMVRCMAAIYYWLRSASSVKPEKNRSPLLSKSSTSVILPRRGTTEDREWSCKSMIEISWISTDKSQFSRASYAINNYRILVEQLERVNAKQMESGAQMAFWINVYNSLVMHAYLAYGIPHSSLRRMALFHKAAYNIGGHLISADAMEQFIFRFRTPRIGRWFEPILTTALRKKSEEKKVINSRFGLESAQPLVAFALCTGAYSDPMLKVYTAPNVKEELEVAKKDFLQANVVVKKSRKVFLPKLLEKFAKEASINSDDLLKWVSENVDKKLHDSIQKCVDCGRKASQIIEWLPYSTRFRYTFGKDLTEKPWWL